jgi:hypothetical protein
LAQGPKRWVKCPACSHEQVSRAVRQAVCVKCGKGFVLVPKKSFSRFCKRKLPAGVVPRPKFTPASEL